MIKASIIITSFNNSHNLEQCLISLINQDYDRKLIDLEIIVVDSGSTDNSIEILNKYKDKIKIILKSPHLFQLSPAVARNIGAQNAKGDILILSDSDCILPSSWAKYMVASFKDSQVDCVVGSREPDIGCGLGTFIRRYDFILYSNKFRIPKPILINERNLQKGTPFVLLSGNNFAIKKEIWNKLGGMKTIFRRPAGEDIMLEIELIKSGYNILFNPQSKVIHNHPISLIKLFKKAFPRSEAIYLLGRHSENFVNWSQFAERGHIFHLKRFFQDFSFGILFFLIVSLLKIPSLIKLLILLTIILLVITNRLFRVSRKLESILSLKKEKYKRTYKIPLFKLFCFEQIHFFLKGLSLINFLWCSLIYWLKDRYAHAKRIINS